MKRSVLRRKSYVKKQTAYRPALTYLLHLLPSVHALVITEQTRVCRSAALFLEIADQIIRHRVTVHGTIQESGWFHQRDSGGNLMRGVFSAIAENQLFEVLMGSLRGISTMLLAGRPHSTIPFWLERDPHTSVAKLRNGEVTHPRTMAERKGFPTLRRLLEIWRESQADGSDYGYQAVANKMTAEGWPTPDDAGAWSAPVVRSTLLTPALRGVQVMFGIEWHVFPAIVSDAEFWKIQRVVQQRAGLYGAGHVPMYSNMLAGLLRCHCGATLVRDTHGLYRCRSVHNGRQKIGGRHIHVTQKRIEDFVDLWMKVCKEVTIASLRQDADGSTVRREMNRMAEQAASLRRRLEAKRAEGRTAIEGHARAIIRASDPARFEEQINTMVTMFLAEDEEFKTLSEQYNQTRVRQLQIERSLQRATPPVELKHLIEYIQSWETLKNVQKNEVLRALLTEMRFHGRPGSGNGTDRFRQAVLFCQRISRISDSNEKARAVGLSADVSRRKRAGGMVALPFSNSVLNSPLPNLGEGPGEWAARWRLERASKHGRDAANEPGQDVARFLEFRFVRTLRHEAQAGDHALTFAAHQRGKHFIGGAFDVLRRFHKTLRRMLSKTIFAVNHGLTLFLGMRNEG